MRKRRSQPLFGDLALTIDSLLRGRAEGWLVVPSLEPA
jgi:hypothetical protein